MNAEKFRSIIENSFDLIALLDLDGCYTYCNCSYARILGYDPDEMIGRSGFDIVHPDERAEVATLLKNSLVDQEVVREMTEKRLVNRIRHHDGSYRWVEHRFKFLLDENGIPAQILLNAQDITDHRQTIDELRESESRFKAVSTYSHNAICLLDESGKIVWINEAFVQMGGYSKEQVYAAASFVEYLAPESVEFVVNNFMRFVRHEPYEHHYTFYFVSADGQKHFCEKHMTDYEDRRGKRILAISMVDITERQQLEEKLRQEKILTDAIFNSVPGVLYLYDEQGYLLRWNKKHEELTGYSKEELDHFHLLDWYKGEPEDIERVTKGVQKALAEGFASAEANLITKDGSKILFDFTASRLNIGDKVYFTGIGIDITARRKLEEQARLNHVELLRLLAETERSRQALLNVVEDQKAAEEQIRRLNAELEQRVRDRTALLTAANQELEAFAYSVSHDLRAPLRALDGFSSALLEDYASQLDERGKHYLSRIQEAAQRMGQLINDLLNLSRVTRSDFARQRVDLSALVENIAAELKIHAPQRRVEFDIAADIIVQGDRNLLKIAMENLLSNAYKFTNQCEQAHIQFGRFAQDGKWIYFVRDNGVGFDMEYANKLFIPFQRLHGVHEFSGTGIGLTIVQRIITRHDGQIWAEAAVDQGATFYFTLGESG
jgi:PAS domain S-box-containing protein